MAKTNEHGVIIPTTFMRTPYNYDRDEHSMETGTDNQEPTETQQQFKDECDINTILERFGVTGELPMNIRQPVSTDFVEAFDFQTAQNAIIAARESFMEMPAKVRARFDNDPQKFITFFEDEANRQEAETLGLVNPKTPAPPAGDTPPQGD